MPDGRVMRIDEDRQRVVIVRRGRSYEAPLTEVESAARVPSARVRFSLRRTDGVEEAERVTLRSGTRTSKRQRRFGDLTGARQPGAKVATTAQTAFGINVTTQPFRVVEAWIEAIADQDFDGATSLYSPSALVHTNEGTITGRNRLRALQETCSATGDGPTSEQLHGIDRFVRAECQRDGAPVTTYLFVENGRIVEQWLGTEPELPGETDETISTEVVTRGQVSEAASDYARQKLDGVFRFLDGPILLARIKLTQAANPSIRDAAMAEATVDFDGSLIRAHAAAMTINEAIDQVGHRLQSIIEHRSDRERRKADGIASVPGEWRRSNLPSPHPPYFDRPEEEREVVRHKSFAPDEMSIEEAVWDMVQLDYDFYLFVEFSTGTDCLVERTTDGDIVVHQLGDRASSETTLVIPPTDGMRRSEVTPPRLLLDDAIEFLDTTRDNFVFFQNSATERANVIYRRYDGHYGLITPPLDEPD